MTDIADRMAEMSLKPVASNIILDKLSTNALRELYKNDNKNADTSSISKRRLRKTVDTAINYSSAKMLINALRTEHLIELLEPVQIDHKHNNPTARMVLVKRATEQMTMTTVADFLTQYATVEILKICFESLELDVPASATKKTQLIEELTTMLDRNGLEIYLKSLNVSVLRDALFDLKLEKDPSAAPSKGACITAIMAQKPVTKVKRVVEKREVVISSKQPRIRDGISYDDLFSWYNLTDLVAWCKKNGLRTSGTKKEVINRMLAYFEGDKENTMAGPVRRKAKRTKKATATKKAAADNKKKKTTTAEEVESEDSQAESEDDMEADEAKEAEVEAKKDTTAKVAADKVESEDDMEDEEDEEDDAEAEAAAEAAAAKAKADKAAAAKAAAADKKKADADKKKIAEEKKKAAAEEKKQAAAEEKKKAAAAKEAKEAEAAEKEAAKAAAAKQAKAVAAEKAQVEAAEKEAAKQKAAADMVAAVAKEQDESEDDESEQESEQESDAEDGSVAKEQDDDVASDEDMDDIDLDALDSYSLSFLQKYCAEEEIPWEGKTKEQLVKLIDQYNTAEE